MSRSHKSREQGCNMSQRYQVNKFWSEPKADYGKHCANKERRIEAKLQLVQGLIDTEQELDDKLNDNLWGINSGNIEGQPARSHLDSMYQSSNMDAEFVISDIIQDNVISIFDGLIVHAPKWVQWVAIDRDLTIKGFQHEPTWWDHCGTWSSDWYEDFDVYIGKVPEHAILSVTDDWHSRSATLVDRLKKEMIDKPVELSNQFTDKFKELFK